MHIIRLFVFAFWIIYSSACGDFYSAPNVQQDKPAAASSAAKIDFGSLIRIPRAQSGFDIGYGSALLSNGDIWATAGWNARGDNVYRWSLVDRKWYAVNLPVTGMSVKASIYFKDSQDGWLINERIILRSDDGGQNWISIPLEPKSEITRLQAVNFIDSQIGFIAGTTGYMNRDTFEPEHGVEILCTEDGGRVFRVCYKSREHETVHEILNLKNEKTAVALVDGTILLITTNGGKDWTEKPLPASANGTAVDNDGIVWMVGSNGTFFYSRDLGSS